jgi:hypothetical protein
MPGATETEFFERADMMDTKIGTESKMDAGEVARIGFKTSRFPRKIARLDVAAADHCPVSLRHVQQR